MQKKGIKERRKTLIKITIESNQSKRELRSNKGLRSTNKINAVLLLINFLEKSSAVESLPQLRAPTTK